MERPAFCRSLLSYSTKKLTLYLVAGFKRRYQICTKEKGNSPVRLDSFCPKRYNKKCRGLSVCGVLRADVLTEVSILVFT